MGLLARGLLRMESEERAGFVRTRRIVHLRVAPDAPVALPPAVASLIGVVCAAEPGGLTKDVVKQSLCE